MWVVASLKISGCCASHCGVTRFGAFQRCGTKAIIGWLRQRVSTRSRSGGCGIATRPMSSVPAASRDIASFEPEDADLDVDARVAALRSASSTCGSRSTTTPVEVPRRTRPDAPLGLPPHRIDRLVGVAQQAPRALAPAPRRRRSA